VAEQATAEGPPRRRASWNLRTIVEDVAGRPIEELQDPSRPTHPYLKGRLAPPVPRPPETPPAAYDPVGRLYPPLVGATARDFHGTEFEHHAETIERHQGPSGRNGPGPLRRPERLYLHYLLLHLDRLSGTALQYLRNAIDEEVAHRAPPAAGAPVPPARQTPPDP
jgi:hypothetical protein